MDDWHSILSRWIKPWTKVSPLSRIPPIVIDEMLDDQCKLVHNSYIFFLQILLHFLLVVLRWRCYAEIITIPRDGDEKEKHSTHRHSTEEKHTEIVHAHIACQIVFHWSREEGAICVDTCADDLTWNQQECQYDDKRALKTKQTYKYKL